MRTNVERMSFSRLELAQDVAKLLKGYYVAQDVVWLMMDNHTTLSNYLQLQQGAHILMKCIHLQHSTDIAW